MTVDELIFCGGMVVVALFIAGMWAVIICPRDHSDEYYYDWKARHGRDDDDNS